MTSWGSAHAATGHAGASTIEHVQHVQHTVPTSRTAHRGLLARFSSGFDPHPDPMTGSTQQSPNGLDRVPQGWQRHLAEFGIGVMGLVLMAGLAAASPLYDDGTPDTPGSPGSSVTSRTTPVQAVQPGGRAVATADVVKLLDAVTAELPEAGPVSVVLTSDH